MDSVGAVLICVGRLFQNLGAAMANALSLLDFSLGTKEEPLGALNWQT